MRTIMKALVIAAITGAVAIPVAIAAETYAQQPHMTAALDHLKAAKKELEAAAPDKGGHRVAAIRMVDSAIVHVQEGIAVGAKGR
jgi:hypothetical protein